ncbi:MAG: hypothetical protein IPH64_14555 [Comamonadaceae bacterium]|jgi:hypothetical protein|uniref:hypothetical protein n=1 Tax=Candidatus Skiveiella danica TaxID=3386177 RepID=UPI001E0A3742|nr:hypothetical protein [Comamonadaceae bacterium]MBK6928834.1 hypothetical protein [Comamonadaceae bacterium]MBK7120106.1 hypothetical protein [Comamonadaceae bacterium]MBK7507880.1 hypothetical protein [Comamonadaceae bacterium]MBK9198051.1 hypothetical protein [Betaproteobacteria bacterium]
MVAIPKYNYVALNDLCLGNYPWLNGQPAVFQTVQSNLDQTKGEAGSGIPVDQFGHGMNVFTYAVTRNQQEETTLPHGCCGFINKTALIQIRDQFLCQIKRHVSGTPGCLGDLSLKVGI